MSALCQKRIFCAAAIIRSPRWHGRAAAARENDAERLGSLEVGDHHCLLNGQASRLCKFKSLEFRNRTVTHVVMIRNDFE
jgi:hypothetical protein